MAGKQFAGGFGLWLVGSILSWVVAKMCDSFVPGLAGNALASDPFSTAMFGGCATLVGYVIGRATVETPAKRRKQLVAAIPSLSIPERAILLIVASMGDVWATDEMMGPASSLMNSGYITATYTGGIKGDCYVMDARMKAAIEKNDAAVEAMQEAKDYPARWGYQRN